MVVDKKYMARCLQLAKGGRENVAPNPMVGCVVVHDGKIIGEGFHRKCGEAHAEVNAIASVKDQSLLKDSTLYVSLEPCSHYGKTPPCAELIIQKQIPRVVVACLDPFPAVSGRGVNMLREAGIEVVTGVMEQEARELNRIFMVSHLLGRPYVLLKWAQSEDGFMDIRRKDRSVPAVCFSTPETSQTIHKLRSEYMAIMVGYCTGLLDNPSLTVRSWSGRSPVRVLVDRNLDLPPDSFLLDGSVPTILFTEQKKQDRKNVSYIPLDPALPVLNQVLTFLYSQQITSLMVEGGSRLLSSFLQEDLWDEIQIETAPLFLHEGVQVPCPGWREKAVPLPSSSYHIHLLTNPVNRMDRFGHTDRLQNNRIVTKIL
ncbi:MAG: bifunctional diaminohydroxyphosphoribosylaminopyrimidine deaminase/5-amino-6-(5-phosphoribosylamino)uracil reductase RibD [Tannerellaceae bacterium]|nr:bifunctional diaminohydroxyphosphoribosylaminopyrimidine deaminase/5-amino-6-(5-phosphoribosylamino)uracil reductase RibD [Tannerellaceae bacterium]